MIQFSTGKEKELILTAAVILLALYGTKIAPWGAFHEDYHSPGKTNALKGIFVLFVFASHCQNYLDLSGREVWAFWPVEYVGQQMVAPFLFWSGFGIMESIRRKGTAYVRGLPKNRCLKLLLHFDCALFLFLLVRFIIKNDFRYILCLLAAVLAFFCMRQLQYRVPFGMSVYSMVFMILLTLLTMKTAPDNRFLQYLGDNVFEIYILQRIPMRLMRSFRIARHQPVVFVLLSFVITCILAYLFRRAMEKLDKKLFPK